MQKYLRHDQSLSAGFEQTDIMEKIIWVLWIKTTDETNGYEHHCVKTKRHNQQQFFVRHLFMLIGRLRKRKRKTKKL
jgi:hypothetical protein